MNNILLCQIFSLSSSDCPKIKSLAFAIIFGFTLLSSNLAHAQLPVTYDFESGFQGWTNNGNDSGLYSSSNWACSGSQSIYSKDDETANNQLTSPIINLTSYNFINIAFCHKSSRVDNGEGFTLEFFDGSNWSTIRTFTMNNDFFNNGTGDPHNLSANLSSSDYTFSSNSRFRLSGTANANNEWNLFDDIVITEVPPPSNDNCADAINLTPNDSCISTTGTTAASTQSLPGCSGIADDDVWYAFTATGTNHNIIVDPNSLQDAVIEAFDSCGGMSIGCEDSTTGTSTEELALSGLTIGNTYYLRIFSHSSGSSNQGDFEICVINLPANDDCLGAINLTPGELCTSTTGTTENASQSLSGCAGSADDDVWYSFNATATEHEITVDPSTLWDAVIEAFDSCGGLSLGCEDSTATTSNEVLELSGLTIGNTYYVRVYSYFSGSANEGEFEICITEPCTPSTATGTSSLGCPFVDLGGVGLGSTAPPPVDCTVGEVTIEATYLSLGDTSDYIVESIPYNPPFQFGCLANPVSVNQDDVWSPVVDLPFDFCFYGNSYDSCVIGSNGVISFDTSLANGPTGFHNVRNIPNTFNAYGGGNGYYFGPSIHGVHHDVDPSVGGEIGYQLITLDSGCRALVAAWADVPMYNDNSILYTGMIVFYEDTNIIEVYVKEKNIDSYSSSYGGPWNNGNASIGLQADSNEGISPPGRNTTSADWTAIDEAWRFVPSGSPITDLKWYEGSIAPANEIIDPDDDGQIIVSRLGTTTYIAEVTYNLCNGSTIVETNTTDVTITGGKIWNGSQNTDWENPNNWTPTGVPVASDCIDIPNTSVNPIMTNSTDGVGRNLRVYNGATLSQDGNSTLTLTEEVNVDTGGVYSIDDSASLIQVDNVVNAVDGTFEMDRTTTIRRNDYVYWSSPVSSFNIENVSSGTANGYKYQWLPFVTRTPSFPDPLDYGEWESYDSGTMDVGRGYIIKGPNGHPSTPTAFTATFSGIPNNGDIIQPIQRSSYTGADYTYQATPFSDILLVTSDDDNWNLVGNPYPSAISAIDFLTLPANSNIDGVVYLWTHGTDLNVSNPDSFYEDFVYNYNVADYIAYNASGTSTPSGFSGNIGAGQGFFVLMNDSGSTSETVTFTNAMRSSAYANNQFYRNTDSSDSNSRIWIDYISSDGNTNTTLVAYVDGATNDKDRLFDAINAKGNGLNLYSMIEEDAFLIQGRQCPFVDTDSVPLGINITNSGIQTIAINSIEGEIVDTNQNIYLEDTELNIIHNLKVAPYTFTSGEGTFNQRFILRFNNLTLSTDDEIIANIDIRHIDNVIDVLSTMSTIESFELIDITGRTIYQNLKINNQSFSYSTQGISNGTYIVRVSLVNGLTTSKKVIL